ncbi:MAG: zinc-dependent peptidase [Flavobacteriales bacterium]
MKRSAILYNGFRGEIKMIDLSKKKYGFLSPRNYQICDELFTKTFDFYRQLSPIERYNFNYRVIAIYKQKYFRGMEGFEITMNHKLLISSVIARLTFGIKYGFDLPRFEVIQVFPKEFYSRLFEQHVKGLTVGTGSILMSWQDFESGFSDDDDRINLGLHEFAHALKIEFDHFDGVPEWTRWLVLSEEIRKRVLEGETHYFRKYAGSNFNEFFAVSVECFFEQPHQFRDEYPMLYDSLSGLLGQDPATRFNPTK